MNFLERIDIGVQREVGEVYLGLMESYPLPDDTSFFSYYLFDGILIFALYDDTVTLYKINAKWKSKEVKAISKIHGRYVYNVFGVGVVFTITQDHVTCEVLPYNGR